MEERITMAHGSGGEATARLIEEIFAAAFDNEYLNELGDASIMPGAGRIAMTTDSYVVTPLIFVGGSIGKLSVCGTVNDLAVSGAEPKYLSCGFILEEGLEVSVLRQVVADAADAAREAGVKLVTGDTKVIQGSGGLYINTAGVGFVPEGRDLTPKALRPGDVLILSGALGDHHATVLTHRLGMTDNDLRSDCAPLNGMIRQVLEAGIGVRAMRDVTRGGLATVLGEFARAAGFRILLEESALPVHREVRDLSGILGLDPLYMANEGKLVLAVPADEAEKALAILRAHPYGGEAAVVGQVTEDTDAKLVLRTGIGGARVLGPLYGEGLPRIC